MPGRPFTAGHDSRRNLRGALQRPHAKTLRTLARGELETVIATLKDLMDKEQEPKVRLEAARLLASYSDGEPGAANVPEEEPEDGVGPEEQARLLALIQPPALDGP
jgi:hypothetical protein